MILNKRQILFGEEAVISHFEFKPPLVATGEMKSEACFIFPINTVGSSYRQDGVKSIKTGEGLLMKCGPYINKWESINYSTNSEVVITRLLPELLKNILDHDNQKELSRCVMGNEERTTSEMVPLDSMLEKYLESLFLYFDHPHLVSDELVFLKIKELCLLLIKIPQQNNIKRLLFSLFEPEKFNLLEIVDANYLEDLSIQELASLSNMSVTTYQRKFKLLFKESPSTHIRIKRLNRSKVELENTEKTIADIAFQCGYSDPNYFSKSFIKQFGLSPSEYRLGLSREV